MITDKKMDKIAKLSEINLSDAEGESIKSSLEQMIEYIDVIKSVDTEGIEPMFRVHDAVNVWRKDYVNEYEDTALIRDAAPDKESGYSVPRTVDEE